MKHWSISWQFLGKRTGHQQIAQVDDGLGKYHFEIRCAGTDDAECGKFSGRSEVCETHDRSRKRMDAKIPGSNAKGEGNGEVAECDRNAVTESFFIIFHIYTFHNAPITRPQEKR